MTHSRSSLLSWGLLMALGAIWGASFMAVELALNDFAPLIISTFRITLGAAFLFIVLRWQGGQLPPIRRGAHIWRFALALGLFSNALPFTLLSWGQENVSSGFAGVTMALIPLTVLPLAHFFVPGERMTPRKILGFVVGFIGVYVLLGTQPAEAGAASHFWSKAACIAATISYAIGAVITRHAPQVPALQFSTAALICATGTMVPLALIMTELPNIHLDLSLLGVVYLGLFATGLATLFLVAVIRMVGPTFLSLVNYQIPIWAAFFGVFLLGESLPERFLPALFLILSGVAIAQSGRRR